MKTVKLIVCLMTLTTWSWAQQHQETIKEDIVFEQPSSTNVLFIANINGGIQVEAYSGNTILLEVKKNIKAKTPERLQQALGELDLGIIDRLDTILVYVKSPCNPFGKRKDNWHGKSENRWGYNWDQDCQHRDSYDYSFDFTLKVPTGMNLYISTINDGDVSVKGVKGNLSLHNINGSIAMEEGEGITTAHTINGDVDLTYSKTPGGSSKYYTLNGDINAWYPQNFGADISFKSHNGDLYTDIQDLEFQPIKKKKSASTEEGIAFRVETRSSIKIRNGGVRLDFETFNGNVYIREQ